MTKTITLRLDAEVYDLFRKMADEDNRPISNFIETATKRYIEAHEHVDEFEMAEINRNEELKRSLKRGHADAKKGKGRLVG